LVKLNGIPYCTIKNSDYYNILASYSNNPLLLLLEVIWTRLSYKFKIDSSIFGEDMEVEKLNPFLGGLPINREGMKGWEYYFINLEDEKLEEGTDANQWEPVYLNETQFIVIQELCIKGQIKIDKDFIKFIKDRESNFMKFINCINETGLVFLDKNDNTLKLLTDNLQTAVTPEGFVAGENKSGHFTRWLNKKYKKENNNAL
jgi:hypothetical protein